MMTINIYTLYVWVCVHACQCVRARARRVLFVYSTLKNQSICVTVFGLFSCTNFIFSEVAKATMSNVSWMNFEIVNVCGLRMGFKSLLRLPGVISNIRTSTQDKKRSTYFGFALLDYLLFRRKFLIPVCLFLALSLSFSRSFPAEW